MVEEIRLIGHQSQTLRRQRGAPLPRIGVAEFIMEAGELCQGDEVVIIGPTTGAVTITVGEIRVGDLPVAKAVKGELFYRCTLQDQTERPALPLGSGCHLRLSQMNAMKKLMRGAAVMTAALAANLCTVAQEAAKPSFWWDVDFSTVFDNREGDSKYTDTRTYFQTQLAPR